MTSAISLSGYLSLPGPRTGERGAQGDDAKGQGFADTLAEAVGSRSSRSSLFGEHHPRELRLRLLDVQNGPRLSLQSNEAALPSEDWVVDDVAPEAPQDTGKGEDWEVPELASTELDQPESGIQALDFSDPMKVPSKAGDMKADETATTPAIAVKTDARSHDAGAPAADSATTLPDAAAGVHEKPARDGSADTPPVVMNAATAHANLPAAAQTTRILRPHSDKVVDGPAISDGTREPGTGEARNSAHGGAPAAASHPVQAVAAGVAESAPSTSTRITSAPPTSSAAVPQDAGPLLRKDAADTGKPAGETITRAIETAHPRNARSALRNADDVGQRVTVVAANNAPAPAPSSAQVLGSASAGLVSEIAANPAWRSAAQADAAIPGARQVGLAGVQSLRIQLQPIELGMVTARLTQSGSQMSIEIQVESNDARQRLSQDSEQIIKALKAVGVEVDKVTIQQAPPSTPNHAAQQQGGHRDIGSQTQQQNSADSGSRGQSERGTTGQQGEGSRHGGAEKSADRTGGGVYI